MLPALQVFSAQLIVLPKLNDLFLELKETQCREKGTDRAQGSGGGRPRRCRKTPGPAASTPASTRKASGGRPLFLGAGVGGILGGGGGRGMLKERGARDIKTM